MEHITKYTIRLLTLLPALCVLGSCDDMEYEPPVSVEQELIQYIKKDYDAPVIVNNRIDFAFAIASRDGSSLDRFEITASYPGQPGTTVDPNVYWTLTDGVTHSREMLTGITTNGAVTSGAVIDGIEWYPGAGATSGYSSQAVTMRYSYIVPEEARGGTLQFRITSTNRNGKTQQYSTLEYSVENMDMLEEVVLSDPPDNSGKRYFSISEMKSYTLAEVEAQNKSAVIDFVYRFDAGGIPTPGGGSVVLNSCIAAPSNSVYLDDGYVPGNWTRNATVIESRKWDDMQLKEAPPKNFVTDMDIQNITFGGNTFGEYDLRKDFGLVMKTADGRYHAFIYLKEVGQGTVTIGVKRLEI